MATVRGSSKSGDAPDTSPSTREYTALEGVAYKIVTKGALAECLLGLETLAQKEAREKANAAAAIKGAAVLGQEEAAVQQDVADALAHNKTPSTQKGREALKKVKKAVGAEDDDDSSDSESDSPQPNTRPKRVRQSDTRVRLKAAVAGVVLGGAGVAAVMWGTDPKLFLKERTVAPPRADAMNNATRKYYSFEEDFAEYKQNMFEAIPTGELKAAASSVADAAMSTYTTFFEGLSAAQVKQLFQEAEAAKINSTGGNNTRGAAPLMTPVAPLRAAPLMAPVPSMEMGLKKKRKKRLKSVQTV